MVSLEWIKKQKGKKGWMNIDELIKQVTSDKDEGSAEGDVKEDYQKSYVEKEWYPEQKGDKSFPKVWLQTEYRKNIMTIPQIPSSQLLVLMNPDLYLRVYGVRISRTIGPHGERNQYFLTLQMASTTEGLCRNPHI